MAALKLLENREKKVARYFTDLQAGIRILNTPPQTAEAAYFQFLEKRYIVETLVEQVNIRKGRERKIVLRLKILVGMS